VTDKKALFVRKLFSSVPAEYDWLLDILSFRQDRYWRDRLVKTVDSSGHASTILDVATGTGLVASRLVKQAGPESFIVGVALTLPMLKTGKASLAAQGQSENTDWVLARAENLPFRDGAFDATTISLALRNVSDAQKTISEMSRTTRLDGLVISLDFARPSHQIQKVLYYPYIIVFFPPVGRLVSRAWYDTFRYLGPSILRARTGNQVVALLKKSSVSDTRSVSLNGGIVCLVYGTKRPSRQSS